MSTFPQTGGKNDSVINDRAPSAKDRDQKKSYPRTFAGNRKRRTSTSQPGPYGKNAIGRGGKGEN